MKLASFARNGAPSYGVVKDDALIDLGARLRDRWPDLRALLGGGLETARALAADTAPDVELAEVQLAPVIPNPDKILCVGLNYRAHAAEVGRPVESRPVIFARFASSQLAHGRPILKPRVSDQLDYEGELAVIIGKGGRYIPEEEALSRVAGYAPYNDATLRDWQRHTHQYTPGKNFPATGGFGPWMTTADEVADPAALHLRTRVNGEVVQDSGLSDLIFPIPELIAYLSSFTELFAGDVILTGTPAGVGSMRKPPLWLKAGDTVEVEVGGVGTLANPVADEA